MNTNTNTNTAPILALLELVNEARNLAGRRETVNAMQNVDKHAANLEGREIGSPLERDVWVALDQARALLNWAMDRAARAV